MANTPPPPSVPGSVGPGSQPLDEDGGKLEYMQMPSEMMTYAAPDLPEPEDVENVEASKQIMAQMIALLENFTDNGAHNVIDLSGLDQTNLNFINQLLGEGEVSVIGADNSQGQEAVFAGVWRVRRADDHGNIVDDRIEIATFPTLVSSRSFVGARSSVELPETPGDNIFNSPALFAEINENIPKVEPGTPPYVINLSLLPHTEEDLELLNDCLGRSTVTILSRGYGNCRVIATNTQNCWWVQFFNSTDDMILNTIEITTMPEVVCASGDDMGDSHERLVEILEIYQ